MTYIKKQLVLMTAERARELLAHNDYNRRIHREIVRAKVERLKRIIEHGEWAADEGKHIVIGKDGALVNGQHRLTAISETGAALPVWVFTCERTSLSPRSSQSHRRS